MRVPRVASAAVAAGSFCVALLSACGGGGGSPGNPPPATYTVGGTVGGLGTNGLALANGADTLTLAAGATTFTLPTPLAAGSGYAVTVKTQPAHAQCTLAHASGTVANANVTDVQVSCVPLTHALGGTIGGLVTAGLMLANGADTLAVPAGASSFTLPQPVAETAPFAVSVNAQPTGQSCSVSGGSGTMGNADVTSVQVICSTLSYSLGGTIAGLAANGLVLANGSDTVAPAAGDTAFTFPASVAYGTSYDVIVQQQPAGSTCTVAGSFPATMGAGNVGNIAVSCQTTSSVVALAGQDTCPSTNLYADGQGSTASVPVAYSMVQDGAGNLLVSEGTVLRRITPSGLVTTLAGVGGSPGSVDGSGAAARLESPNGITLDSTGDIFVADLNTVRTVTPAGVVSTLAGSHGFTGYADGTGSNARFNVAYGVARDAAGNLFVADVNNNLIRKVTPAGAVTTFSGSTTAGFADGPGPSARFNSPIDIGIDSHGALYVADAGNHAIRKVATDGSVTTLAGGGPTLAGFADGSGSSARFLQPNRLAIGADNTLYVLDQHNGAVALTGDAVRVVDPAGSVTTLGAIFDYEVLHPGVPVPASARVQFAVQALSGNTLTGVGAGRNGVVYVGWGCAVYQVNP